MRPMVLVITELPRGRGLVHRPAPPREKPLGVLGAPAADLPLPLPGGELLQSAGLVSARRRSRLTEAGEILVIAQVDGGLEPLLPAVAPLPGEDHYQPGSRLPLEGPPEGDGVRTPRPDT